jgi:hypothetical protein
MEETTMTLAGKPERAEPAAKPFAARDKLSGALEKYQQLNTELSGFEAKLARLEVDEAEALDESASSTDEEGGYERLGEIRLRIEVHGKRVGHKRQEVAKSLAALEAACKPLETDLNGLVNTEMERRGGILTKRVLEAIEWPDDKPHPIGLAQVINVSPLIWVIFQCNPSTNVFSPLSIEAKVEELLTKADRLESEMGKSI